MTVEIRSTRGRSAKELIGATAELGDSTVELGRQTFQLSVPGVDPQEQVTGAAPLSMSVAMVTRVQTNHPCRLRVYTNTALRDQDIDRPAGVEPNAGVVMLDILTTPTLLDIFLAPVAVLARTASVYSYVLQGLAQNTEDYVVTFTAIRLEG